MPLQTPQKTVDTDRLRIAYLERGPATGVPVMLLHGFPYDVHAFAEVTDALAEAGCRVIAPHLRGFGGTRFLSPDTLRSGQQAALAQDLLGLMDALGLPAAVLAGFDWGGRAACIVSALRPERVLGLVSDGYSIQDIARSMEPQPPEIEARYWYQYYFHGERGRRGLATYRRELCEALWRTWSPDWGFAPEVFARTAASFDNPDFVEVVIHSYRHRFGLVAGDPALEETERLLARLPTISIPTISLHGASDGVTPPEISEADRAFFRGAHERRVLPGIGHNLPQEAPRPFAEAILDLVPIRPQAPPDVS